MGDMRADEATVEYFDSHAHHYSAARIAGVADLVRDRLGPDASLCDVGSGGGRLSSDLPRNSACID